MNKKDKLKLDVISAIDEDIIDRNTKKRIKLYHRTQRKYSKPLPMVVALAACLLAAFLGVFLITKMFTKQVPVYQGMTISSATNMQISKSRSHAAGYTPLAAMGTFAQKHDRRDGEVSGDYKQDREEIDQEAPFGNEHEAPPIEDVVKNSLEVMGGDKNIYYAMPNEDVYITIHIHNPDNYEILSFTLNGQKYSSYMFEDGSDMEHLVLKVNVGDIEGIVEYTIDAIKYVDGTEIKDVRMDGDKTVRAGVYTDRQPIATVKNETIGYNDFTLELIVEDPVNLIANSVGDIQVVLYDGERIVATQKIDANQQSVVSFAGLKTNTLYQYAVVASYDPLDGNGFDSCVLQQKAFCTKAIVLFDNVQVTDTQVSFSFAWDADFTTHQIQSLTLYQNGNKVRDVAVDATVITDLLSNTSYTLVAEYMNRGEAETIFIDFCTPEKALPTVRITPSDVTQTSIGFDVSLISPNTAAEITKIAFLHGENIISETDTVTALLFENLLSNNTYTVRVTYTYDLNDGNGVHTETKEIRMQTEAKTVPVISFVNQNQTRTSLLVDYDIHDPDQLATVTKIELLKDGVVLKNADIASSVLFDGLNSATLYAVKITYTFDLNDGYGLQEKTALIDMVTDCKEIKITDVQIFGESAIYPNQSTSVLITVNNPDQVEITSFTMDGIVLVCNQTAPNLYMCTYTAGNDGGKIDLVCTNIQYRLFAVPKKQATNFDSEKTIFVLGDIAVESITVEKNFYAEQEVITGTVTFIGSEAYEIQSVFLKDTIMGTKSKEVLLSKVSDNVYTFTLCLEKGNYCYQVASVTYGIGTSVNTTELASDEFCFGVGKIYSNVIDISTPEQFQNMVSGNAYRLVADIDLSGINWTPYSFVGALYGNGYVIKNLTVTQIYQGASSASVGLFTETGGYFKDVVLENATVSVMAYGHLQAGIGLLSGSSGAYFDRCSVEGNVSVVVQEPYAELDYYSQHISVFGYGFADTCYYKGTMTLSILEAYFDSLEYSVRPFTDQFSCNSTFDAEIIIDDPRIDSI